MNEMTAIVLSAVIFTSTLYVYLMVHIFIIDHKVSDLNRTVIEILRELREKGGKE